MTAPSPRPTRALAEFAAGLRCADIPPPVLAHAKLVLLDTLGCAIYGASQPWSQIVSQTVGALEPDGASTIWGLGRRCSAPSAALANGTMVQGFELDDYHAASFIHCGAAAVPSALAVAEYLAAREPAAPGAATPRAPTGVKRPAGRRPAAYGAPGPGLPDRPRGLSRHAGLPGNRGPGSSGSGGATAQVGQCGDRVLAALIAGFEVGTRIGLAGGGAALMLRGWHAGAVVGPFLAAATAGSLLGLDAERMTHALGLAGTQAAGLGAAHFGSMAKRVHHGLAARNGVLAALLAANGLTAMRDVLESAYGGFGVSFGGGGPDGFQAERATAELGSTWETLRIGFKPYACVGVAHTALDAIKRLRARHPVPPGQVARVVVSGSRALVEHGGWRYEPRDVTAAQMNVGYAVAAFLAAGDCFVDQFTAAKISDPALVALARRVEVTEDAEFQAAGAPFRNAAKVAVFLDDGTVLREEAVHPWGSDANPLSAGEVLAKYRKLAVPVLGERHAAWIEDLALGLDGLADVRALTGHLVWPPAAS